MVPGRLSPRGEFTPVPSHSSTFVYMIPPQNVMPARVAPGWSSSPRFSHRGENFTPVRDFVTVVNHVNAKRPLVSVWNRFAGRLERVAHAWLIFVNPRWLGQLQHVGRGMMKWPSHHVNVIRNHEVFPVWNSCRCRFSHVNTPLRLVFTSDGVVVGVVIRSIERCDLVKIKPTESEAEHCIRLWLRCLRSSENCVVAFASRSGRVNQSQCSIRDLVIGWVFRFCFRLRQYSFH